MRNRKRRLTFFITFILLTILIQPMKVMAEGHAINVSNDDGATVSGVPQTYSTGDSTTPIECYITYEDGKECNSIFINGQSVNLNNTSTAISDSVSGFSCNAIYTPGINSTATLAITNLYFPNDDMTLEIQVLTQDDNGGGGDPIVSPSILYLAWNNGSQTLTFDAATNPNNIFTVSQDCDFGSLRIYAVDSASQVAGTNDLQLNRTNNANMTTTTIRSFHVVDYNQEPNLVDNDPNNDHPITCSNVNCTVTLIKSGAAAVSLEIPNCVRADGWEFGNTQITDLNAGTTPENAIALETYYENRTVQLDTLNGTLISTIEPMNISDGAVTISGGANGNPFNVHYNSDFYDTVTYKVTLANNAVRYLKIVRKGIEISLYSNNSSSLGYFPNINHGTQPGATINWGAGEEEKIIAVFYYPVSDSYSDYQMVANITYADGSKETRIVDGQSEMNCVADPFDPTAPAQTQGGDYIIWSGSAANRPMSVSVTAIRTGSLSATNFTGASFGSGAGVTWTY